MRVGDGGAPLRGDGTPFPDDPDAWSAEEREYLVTYFFNGDLTADIEIERVVVVDVPDVAAS